MHWQGNWIPLIFQLHKLHRDAVAQLQSAERSPNAAGLSPPHSSNYMFCAPATCYSYLPDQQSLLITYGQIEMTNKPLWCFCIWKNSYFDVYVWVQNPKWEFIFKSCRAIWRALGMLVPSAPMVSSFLPSLLPSSSVSRLQYMFAVCTTINTVLTVALRFSKSNTKKQYANT